MDYYPVQLNLNDKKVIIVGGGKIAQRKIEGLLNTGAKITVVSPDITDGIRQYVQTKKVTWKKKTFSPSDIDDALLVIAAVNEPAINLAIKRAASPNQLLLLTDNRHESDFILPSVLKRGKFMLTVSTSGASPTLTKRIKHSLSEQYGPEYEEYVDFLYECRQWILAEISEADLRKTLLAAITDRSFFNSHNRQQDFANLVNRVMDME